jgi:uncharacterized protein (DUF302 family)
MSNYTFGIDVPGDFEEVRERVIAALAAEGFGVLTEIDVAATMQAKLGASMGPYRILGACNPPLAHQALTADPAIGTLLPCNVVVRRAGDTNRVDFMDPDAVLNLVDLEGIAPLAADVRAKLERVRTSLGN